jgi:hypothetical protein
VLLVSVLHFIADEEYPADLVADYMSAASLVSRAFNPL